MRSADTRKLVVRQTRAVLDARDFAVACAVVWNSLPTDLRVLPLTLPLRLRQTLTYEYKLTCFSPGLAHLRIFF